MTGARKIPTLVSLVEEGLLLQTVRALKDLGHPGLMWLLTWLYTSVAVPSWQFDAHSTAQLRKVNRILCVCQIPLLTDTIMTN